MAWGKHICCNYCCSALTVCTYLISLHKVYFGLGVEKITCPDISDLIVGNPIGTVSSSFKVKILAFINIS